MDDIKEAMGPKLQTEPADFGGTYDMGPGDPGDRPLTPEEIAALVAGRDG